MAVHAQQGLHLLIATCWGHLLLEAPEPCCSAAGVKHSAAYVQGLVDKEIAAGIAANRVVVAGFSQGGHLALKTALFSPQRLAGCVALSMWLEPLKDQVMGCSKPCLCGCAAHLANILSTETSASGEDCPAVTVTAPLDIQLKQSMQGPHQPALLMCISQIRQAPMCAGPREQQSLTCLCGARHL